MSDESMIEAFSRATGFDLPNPRLTGWRIAMKTLWRDLVYASVGLFFLDIGWRLEDVLIDFICNHVSWLAWLGD